MIKSKLYLLLIIISIFKISIRADEFPGVLPGTEIGGNLPNGYEPSGMVWHTSLNLLFIVDDGGDVYSMDADGYNVVNIYSSNYDLEGICIADSSSDYIYIGIENPDGILELNLNTGLTSRLFDLTPWMTGPNNQGLEALTFVQDTSHVEGGYFYAGLQKDGKIYVFELPIKTSDTSTIVSYVETITPVEDRSDLSGLFYDEESDVLYGIWDSDNKLRAMHSDGTYLTEWDLPGNDQEGITLWVGNGLMQRKLFIAEDSDKEVWSYGFNSNLNLTIEGNGTVLLQPETPGYFGSSMILSGIPDPGWFFSEWNGDLMGNNPTDSILMNNDKEVITVFLQDTINYLELVVFLEGSFNGLDMNTDLNNSEFLPLSQPYGTTPWNYTGTESVISIPANTVDWVLIEIRDAADAAAATAATVIDRQAAFIMYDGTILAIDGTSNPEFSGPVTQNLFVVIYHRNHLSVISANAVTKSGGVYPYNFTIGEAQAYGGASGHKEIGTGIWCMIGGDTDADGSIDEADKTAWAGQAGTTGYKSGDLNLNIQVDNTDKNDLFVGNNSRSSQVPD